MLKTPPEPKTPPKPKPGKDGHLKESEMGIQPIGRILVDHPPKVPDPGYLKHNDSVVIIKDSEPEKHIDDFAGFQRCLNDPEGLKGPAIINRAFKGLIQALPVI
jgi:hypothetical protein